MARSPSLGLVAALGLTNLGSALPPEGLSRYRRISPRAFGGLTLAASCSRTTPGLGSLNVRTCGPRHCGSTGPRQDSPGARPRLSRSCRRHRPRIRRWRRNLLDSGVGPVTVAKAYRLLKAIMTTAVDDPLIRRNPCRIKGAGEEKSPERPVLTLGQVFVLADAFADRRYRLFILLAVFCSLRWASWPRSDMDDWPADGHPGPHSGEHSRKCSQRDRVLTRGSRTRSTHNVQAGQAKTCVNGRRKVTSWRNAKIDHLPVHDSSAAVAGTRPRSRSLSR